MENSPYTFKSLSHISIEDQDLAEEFLIKKTKDEVKAYDKAMAKLDEETRSNTVDPFVSSDTILKDVKQIILADTKRFSNIRNLPEVDYAFLIQELSRRYKLLTRNPRLYKLNYEAYLKYYDRLLAENWEVFDQERFKLEKECIIEDKTRNNTTMANLEIVRKLRNLISSIDLSRVNSKSSGFNL